MRDGCGCASGPRAATRSAAANGTQVAVYATLGASPAASHTPAGIFHFASATSWGR